MPDEMSIKFYNLKKQKRERHNKYSRATSIDPHDKVSFLVTVNCGKSSDLIYILFTRVLYVYYIHLYYVQRSYASVGDISFIKRAVTLIRPRFQ